MGLIPQILAGEANTNCGQASNFKPPLITEDAATDCLLAVAAGEEAKI